LSAAEKVKPPAGDFGPAWGVVVGDGWSLPVSPVDALKRGEQARVPVIIGTITREFGDENTLEAARAIVKGVFGENAQKALAFYGIGGAKLPADDPVLGSVSMQIITDIGFRCPAGEFAGFHAQAGGRVWRYQFGWPGLSTGVVGHSSE